MVRGLASSPKAGGSPKQRRHEPEDTQAAKDQEQPKKEEGTKEECTAHNEHKDHAIHANVKKEEEALAHDPYYHAAFTDEEAEEEKIKKEDADKLKKEPQEGEEGKVKEEEMPPNVLEEGHIFFFYRPKVGTLPTTSVDEVQRFEMILQPTMRKGAGPEDELLSRLIIVGKKKLPDITRHERFFAFVQKVAETVEDITSGMGESGFQMKKSGGAHSQRAARLAGSGVYSLCTKTKGRGRKGDVRLAYKLELPLEKEKHHDCQEALGIEPSAYFVLTVKNPEMKARSKDAGLPTAGPKPEYTEKQMRQLSGYAWASPSEDPTILDYKGTELLLIGGRKQQLETSIGPAVGHLEELTRRDEAAATEKAKGVDKKEALTKQVEEQIGHAPDISPVKDGKWK